ncbi:hypothetical protein ACQKLP_03645 [Chitinophaga sp. NPDC101104]|uniref:hypothetical protein n=1 Tax=Chitinophaga sp. NPDC101104 TaxID=3390561 RepID=UPI003D050D0A
MEYDVDLVFRGNLPRLNLAFLEFLPDKSIEIMMDDPADVEVQTGGEIMDVFRRHPTADCIFKTNDLVIANRKLKYAFIHIMRMGNTVELLLFFDAQELSAPTFKKNLDLLAAWSASFREEFGFDEFDCRIDNGDADERYFNDQGTGPLYPV